MAYNSFGTDRLPPDQRFGAWHDLTCRALVATTVRSDHDRDFAATVRLLNCADLRVAELTQSPLQFRRGRRLINQSDPRAVQLVLTLAGELRLDVGGRQVTAGPGTFVLYDTSEPVTGAVTAEGTQSRQIVVHVPRELFPLNPATLGRVTATPIHARAGVGALLARYLRELMAQADAYRPVDNHRLSSATLDLAAALCAGRLDAGAVLPPDVRRRAVWTSIEDFIEQRLHDTSISPGSIAAAHHISTRYLHKLFSDRGTTVMGWLRQRRLERCRRELTDPRHLARPIHDIAVRAGFTGPAQFSRTFRKAYGLAPRDYRDGFVRAVHDGVQLSPQGAT